MFATAFLIANGIGDYGVVEINTLGNSGPPNVIDVFSTVLIVSDYDFDTIGPNISLILGTI